MSLPFPQSVLSQHIIALGKTRAGKSSKLRLIVEQLLEGEEPVCIIDPKGDWWGLKSSSDGKHAGYPVAIFGGEHADVPLSGWKSGGPIAELVATGNRPSLIDLGGWFVGDRTRFFIEFAQTFFKLTRGRRYLVIDEVHNFAPQGRVQDPDAGKMLHWANRLASEGSSKGVTVIAASQRPQKVHKDFVTSCETLIACRVIHKLDRDAIKDWIDGCADPAAGRQVLTELASMERPEAWVWSPEAGFGPKRITFPMFSTYDSFKPQEASSAKLKGWAEVDLEEVRTKLQTVVAEAEASDPKMLRKRIADLEQQLKGIGGLRPEETRAAQDTGYRRGIEDGLEAARQQFEALRKAAEQIDDLARDICGAGLTRLDHMPELPRWQAPTVTVTTHPGASLLTPGTRRALEQVAHAAARQVSTGLKPGLQRGQNGAGDAELGSGGKRRILTALAQYEAGLSARKLSLLIDMSPKGGTWRTYMAELRSKGWITGSSDHLAITEAGATALGSWEPLPTGRELIEYWRRKLGDSGKRAIFDIVINAYPRGVPQETVSERTNIAIAGGTWRTYMAELRGLGLIEGRGELKASEDLFG